MSTDWADPSSLRGPLPPADLARTRARRLFAALAAFCLIVGCGIVTLIPVGEGRIGSPAALRFSKEHTPYASRDVIFSHVVEAHAGEACDTCHYGTASEETTGVPLRRAAAGAAPPESSTPPRGEPSPAGAARAELKLPPMARCFECHDGEAVSNDCIVCHMTNRRDRKPAFHDGLFPRRHGEMAEAEEYKCSLCHVQADCKGCHSERKPLSHTPRFERSTHGRMATHDRWSCATCHETSFCENCHSQPPPDHTPAFLAGGGHKQAALIRARSCTTCHRYQDACARCHG